MSKKVGIIMGSKNDFESVAIETVKQLKEFGIECDVLVASAHRTPAQAMKWTEEAKGKNYAAIVAFAGVAAHLAGVVAAHTNVPVIAVPVPAGSLAGVDALLSMVQMPGGIPVATMAIGKAGAKNAAIFAAQIIATSDETVYQKLEQYRVDMRAKIKSDNDDLKKVLESI